MTKTPTCPLESDEQIMFVQKFRQQYVGVLIHSIPNGGLRQAREALRLKNEGVVKGIPDLFIPEWSLWVEMKRQKGSSLSTDQKEIISHLEDVGHKVIVGYGWQDALLKVNQFKENK
jgi:hypothetical protein